MFKKRDPLKEKNFQENWELFGRNESHNYVSNPLQLLWIGGGGEANTVTTN